MDSFTGSPSLNVVTTPQPVTNTTDQSQALVAFNVNAQVPLKLTSNNYAAWRVQFNSLLYGYNLFGFVDGTTPCPPKTITPDGTTVPVPNPAHLYWFRQDQLLLNAIVGSLTPTLVPFVSASKTFHEAWETLCKAYATLSRSHSTTLYPIESSKI